MDVFWDTVYNAQPLQPKARPQAKRDKWLIVECYHTVHYSYDGNMYYSLCRVLIFSFVVILYLAFVSFFVMYSDCAEPSLSVVIIVCNIA